VEAYIVLAVVVFAAVVVALDVVRQRRRLRDRLDVARLVSRGLDAGSASPGFGEALTRALADAPRMEPERDEDGDIVPSGIWADLEDALDLEQYRPKMAEGTEVAFFPMRWGNDYAIVASADRESHYTLEIWEAEILQALDGSRTVGELIVDRLTESGDFDASAIIGLVESMRRAGLFDPAPTDLPALLEVRLDPASAGRRKFRSFAKDLKVSWNGADRFVRRMYDGGLRLLFSKLAVVVSAVVAVAGLAAFVSVVLSDRFTLQIGHPSIDTIVLILLGFVLTFAHEVGHAMTLVHYRRRVISAGFLLYYGSPAFYIDTSDGLLLGQRQRIAQSFAGPFAEFALAGFSSIALFLFPGAEVANLLYKFAILNYYVIFLNLIPLLELDGYWMLADAIQVPDLRPRSIAFVRSELWHKLRRRERFQKQEVFLGVYGVVGIAFTILTSIAGLLLWQAIFGQLVIDLWNKSFAAKLLMVLLVLFFAGPAIRGLITLVKAIGRRLRALERRIRFRYETSWRVEAAELIDALPAFEDLPVDVLNDLAGRVQLRTLPRGEAVFRQGDRADAFYVVRRGLVVVEDIDQDTGDVRVIRTFGRGDSFGELGLLGTAPRQATVRAVEDAELFRVDKNAFDRLLADAIELPDFEPTMQAYAELRELPPFRRLSTPELAELLAQGEWIPAAPGEALFHQGDEGDAFYVIGSGHAEVRQDGAPIRDLGPGDHFGEIALLEDVPRTASVIAKTPLRVFRLDRAGFDRVVVSAFRSGALPRATDRTLEH
jgi:CRP-like cAMP-binding protein/Zn-dependent protease